MDHFLAAPAERIAPDVARQAVNWWMALQSPDPDAVQRTAWQQWRAAAPEHETAWQRIEAVSGQMSGIPSSLARAALAAPTSQRRRRTVQLLTTLLVAGGSAALLRESAPWQTLTADHASAVGEIRRIALPDGGTLVLGTGSAVNVRFDADVRSVQLVRGEILVQTAKDGRGRPFIVQAEAGAVRAIGTRFTVRQDGGATRVGVLQGAVELTPSRAPGRARLLQAGQSARFTALQVDAAQALDAQGAEGAFADGLLVASHQRLDDFLAEVGRYRRGRLGCDPAVAHLQVSGVYPLADTDRILVALTAALPVEVHMHTRYWVSVWPRPKNN